MQCWIQTELIQELQEVTAAKSHKQLFTKPPGPGPLDWNRYKTHDRVELNQLIRSVLVMRRTYVASQMIGDLEEQTSNKQTRLQLY